MTRAPVPPNWSPLTWVAVWRGLEIKGGQNNQGRRINEIEGVSIDREIRRSLGRRQVGPSKVLHLHGGKGGRLLGEGTHSSIHSTMELICNMKNIKS